jgi:hypothetical protein
MNFVSKILPAVLLIGVIGMGPLGAVHAEGANPVKSIKPIEGIFFDLGTKHGVGYFFKEAKACKIVLTLADTPGLDDAQSFTATRHEALVAAGGSVRYNATEGKAIEFACQADARAMTLRQVERHASEAGK